MSIELTNEAYQNLKKVFPELTSIRINAIQTDGWGNTVTFELAQDEQAGNDEVYQIDEITILVNPTAKKYLEGNIVIDHKQNYGFVIKNSYEILTFGMKVSLRK